MKIKPLSKNILIEATEEGEKTQSGIFIPDTAKKDEPERGKVVAVGSDDDLEVKKGDVVLFKKYGPTKIKVDDKEYLIAKQSDILAIIEK